jgi:UDP-N-acetylmuramoyl-tripeptide--D-alanyl-D-alanine ligase
MLWRWQELCAVLGLSSSEGTDVSGVSIDTRTLSDGDLFVALSNDPGPRFHSSGASGRDGNEFVHDAAAAGAAALLVTKPVDSNLPTLHVDDSLEALWSLGRYARARIQGQVIGVTGSAGKTTTRQWLEALLSNQAVTHGSTGSYNNHWGVPLSLARMPADTAYGVFEIGMNHAGEIRPLSELVVPDVAVILNVLPAHIGQLGSLDAIRKEKLEIRHGLSKNGVLVIPADLEVGDIGDTRVLTFGRDSHADVYGRFFGDRVEVRIGSQLFRYKLGGLGQHLLMTSLAVIAVVHAIGADVNAASEHMASLTLPEGRGNQLKVNGRLIIDDSYNANPVSMGYALSSLVAQPSTRCIAVLGEMLELGEHGEEMHQKILRESEDVDAVVTVGAGFNFVENPTDNFWGHYDSVGDFDIKAFAEKTAPGDAILVKGSNKVFWASKFVSQLKTALEKI